MTHNRETENGTLYIVATPIGNLKDITYRAVEVLQTVDLVLCEDTRTSKTLLKHYDITTPVQSYHAHSNKEKHQHIVSLLESGKNIALISDAGTPGISDPGSLLVMTIHQSEKDIPVIPIPGPSALITLLSVSGFTGNEFTFLGFVPHKKGRETFFASLSEYEHSVIFYESSHRILKTLDAIKTQYEDHYIVHIGREMTKLFETYISGSPSEIYTFIEKDTNQQKGEFVVLLIPRKK